MHRLCDFRTGPFAGLVDFRRPFAVFGVRKPKMGFVPVDENLIKARSHFWRLQAKGEVSSNEPPLVIHYWYETGPMASSLWLACIARGLIRKGFVPGTKLLLASRRHVEGVAWSFIPAFESWYETRYETVGRRIGAMAWFDGQDSPSFAGGTRKGTRR